MYSGFWRSKDSGRILIYAAFDQRLKSEMNESEQFDHAFPDFSQLFGISFQEPTLVYMLENNVLVGVLYPSNDPVPQSVVGTPLTADYTEAELMVARELVSRRIKGSIDASMEGSAAEPVSDFSRVNVSPDFYSRNLNYKSSKKKPTLELVSRNGASLVVSIPISARLWEVDIRKTDTKEQLVKKHAWDVVLWKATVAVIILFLLLATMEGGLFVMQKVYEDKLAESEEMQPLVDEVERRGNMLAKINQITNNQLLPFEMMEESNVIRPANIFFNRFTAEAGNVLQIEAECINDTSKVKEYEESLRGLDMLSSVEISNHRESNNKATFRLILKFKQGVLLPANLLEDSP